MGSFAPELSHSSVTYILIRSLIIRRPGAKLLHFTDSGDCPAPGGCKSSQGLWPSVRQSVPKIKLLCLKANSPCKNKRQLQNSHPSRLHSAARWLNRPVRRCRHASPSLVSLACGVLTAGRQFCNCLLINRMSDILGRQNRNNRVRNLCRCPPAGPDSVF